MDERQARDLLTNAADGVVASDGLGERAERRYQRRRARSQMLATAVAVVVVGAGIATAAVVAGDRSSTAPVSPTLIPRPGVSLTVDTRSFISLAFVNATTGYGLATATSGKTVLAKTDDGARTWHALTVMPAQTFGLALVPDARAVVVWGQSGLYETADEGAHWHKTLGHNVDLVAASADRLWATVQCVGGEGCGNKLMVSRDGRSWTRSTERPLFVGAVATSTKGPGVTFGLALTAPCAGKWELAGTTNGVSWTHELTPCSGSGVPQLAAGGDGVSLMVVCPADGRDRVFVSGNAGRTWTETVPLPAGGRRPRRGLVQRF